MILSDDITWCRKLMGILGEGGTWGVPRSGLLFTKRGRILALTDRVPHDDAMPMTKEELLGYQNTDYLLTKKHFEAAGFEVCDETQP